MADIALSRALMQKRVKDAEMQIRYAAHEERQRLLSIELAGEGITMYVHDESKGTEQVAEFYDEFIEIYKEKQRYQYEWMMANSDYGWYVRPDDGVSNSTLSGLIRRIAGPDESRALLSLQRLRRERECIAA